MVDGKLAGGARFAIEAPRRHPCVERRLKGRDQVLKRVARQAHDIQELHGAGLERGAPSTSHGSCLLSRSRDLRGASYQKESGINSIEANKDRTRVLVRFTAESLSGASFGGTCLYVCHDGQWRAYTIRPSESMTLAQAEAWLVKRKWRAWS